MRQNCSGGSRSTPSPKPIACFQGNGCHLARHAPNVACDQLRGDAHIALRAAIDRMARDLVVAHRFAGAAQAGADDAHQIARLQPAGAEALGQRHQIVGAEGVFQFGQRAERQHQRAP